MKKFARALWAPIDRLSAVPQDAAGTSVWSDIWRTLAVSGIAYLYIGIISAALWGLFSALWVGIPHAILAGTLGDQPCSNTTTTDCFRAIADARQSVLFSAGGLIALVGIVFTYLRWRNEAETTRVAVAGDNRAAEADLRERRQAEIAQVTDALSLLESQDHAKQVAAVSLLGDYATTTQDRKQSGLILTVLASFVRHRSINNQRVVDGQISDETLRTGDVTAMAVQTVANAAAKRKIVVDLSGLVLVELNAPRTNWAYTDLRGTVFSRGNLAWSSFSRTPDDKTELIGVRFLGTKMDGVSFKHTDLDHVEFSSIPTDSDAKRIITMMHFQGADLFECSFNELHLKNARFAGATLVGLTFKGTLLSRPKWARATLENCELHEARVPMRTNFAEVSLSQTTLTPQQSAHVVGLDGHTRDGEFVTRIIDFSGHSEIETGTGH